MVAEAASPSYPLLMLPLNKKIRMNTQNTMASPYHSEVSSTQNMVVPLFSCLGYGAFGKGKVFSENSNCQTLLKC